MSDLSDDHTIISKCFSDNICPFLSGSSSWSVSSNSLFIYVLHTWLHSVTHLFTINKIQIFTDSLICEQYNTCSPATLPLLFLRLDDTETALEKTNSLSSLSFSVTYSEMLRWKAFLCSCSFSGLVPALFVIGCFSNMALVFSCCWMSIDHCINRHHHIYL